MEPYDLKTEKEWKEILATLSFKTKMTASLTDRKGNIIQSKGEYCPLCATIRGNKESLAFICSQTSQSMLAEVMETGKPIVDIGEAGLYRMVVPIMVRREIIGTVSVCGCAVEGEEIDEFYIAKQTGLSENEVLQLASFTPTCKQKDVKVIADQLLQTINSDVFGAET